MDDDLTSLDREALVAEVQKLRAGIRKHRDSSGHDLCWFHPELWDLLPEKSTAQHVVPPWSEFMSRCAQYRASLEGSGKGASARDKQRLSLGAWGLTLSIHPQSPEDLKALPEVAKGLNEAILAMQSLDDLGSYEANEKAWSDLKELETRYRDVQALLRLLQESTGCNVCHHPLCDNPNGKH